MNNFLTPEFKTPLHKANPVVKLLTVVILFFITMFTNSLDFIAYQAILFTLLLFCMSGLKPWKVLVILLPFFFVFLTSGTTMILFGKGDHVWWNWGLIRISEESFYRGIHLGLKCITFGTEGMLFVLSTPSVALLYAMMQKLKLKPKYAYSFMASIRLLPMVWEEFKVRQVALQIRGVRKPRGPKGWLRQVKLYGVPLLAQSIRRAQRVAIAMEGKKFNNESQRSYYYPSTYSPSDLWLVLFIGVGMGAVLWCTNAYPWFNISDVRYH